MDKHIAAVAALDEPTRRRLYDHVVAQREPVGRDDAAAAVGVPRQTAAFHLDKLAGEGLLDVVYERRTGRTGPGAGRPAKLYRRSGSDIKVTLPERRYDLVAHLLARAVEESGETATLNRLARELGASEAADDWRAVLEAHGYEPSREGDGYVLRNCPFHALAQAHKDLVCGMNLNLLTGLLAHTDMRPRLAPEENHCCVRVDPDTSEE